MPEKRTVTIQVTEEELKMIQQHRNERARQERLEASNQALATARAYEIEQELLDTVIDITPEEAHRQAWGW